MAEPVLPRYEASALSDILPSIAARLGLKGFEDVLGLPASDRYVILLVDGLGRALLEASADRAPHLVGLLEDAATLTSVVPSTTAAALTSLGTGLPPGQHGVAGYTFRNPFSGGLLNALTWEPGLSGLDIQPRLTAFEKLARDGVQVTRVMPARFGGTGLTEAGLRGGRLSGVTDESDVGRRIDQVVDAAASGGRSLVYCYERALDHTGHGAGWQSPEWSSVLAWVDALAAGLRSALPDDVRVIITADHGMVDVPADRRVVVEDEPGLLAGIDLVAGEGRFRQLYTTEPATVASRWRDRLGDSAWVRTRDEAADEGWFGYLVPNLASRFGDVLVAAADPIAILTQAMPGELKLIGMHGSLTPAEMYVPLIVE